MASSTEQITLGESGVTKFKDLTPVSWKTIFKRGNARELKWLVHLALFYREELRHPEFYAAQVRCGQSQLP